MSHPIEVPPGNPEAVAAREGKQRVTLIIASRLDHIWMLRAALSGIFLDWGILESDSCLLGIAVTELVNNSVDHGYQASEDGEIKLCLTLDANEVQVELFDHAPALSPGQIEQIEARAALRPASEDWTIRGHGLQIVKKIVDAFTVRSETSGNCMSFRKKVSRPSGHLPPS